MSLKPPPASDTVLWTLYAYSLPLSAPLYVRKPASSEKQATHFRKGFVIRLEDPAGAFGYGEISPLPGLHRESLEHIQTQISQLHELTGLRALLKLEDCYPSLRFGLEMAQQNLQAAQQKRPLVQLLSTKAHTHLPIQKLLTAPLAQLQEVSQQALQEGYTCFKLKVGGRSLEEDITRVHRLRESIGPQGKIRLDANRAWPLEQAVRFGKELHKCQIEFIEEPLQNPSELSSFYQQTGISIALDESLSECTQASALSIPEGTAAFVLKPALLGGYIMTNKWLNIAQERGYLAVISSCFESHLGLSYLASWAAAIPQRKTAMGLGTGGWFQENLLASPWSLKNGEWSLFEVHQKSCQIRTHRLEEVSHGIF